MQNVDELLKKRQRRKAAGKSGKLLKVAYQPEEPTPDAQVALIALDPHTGEIKALVGGRSYGLSQLNHVVAKRQPGSIFKPFVYAAAMDTALENGNQIFTPSSTVLDERTTFWYDSKPYEPDNFKHEFHGTVTFRQALAKSMNVATVRVAEMVGYDAVVDLARRAGLNYNIHPTPAVALGAYEVAPLEMAGAYTMYANDGIYVKPNFISMVRSQVGSIMYRNKPEMKRVLDPRVTYLMVNLMEEVMRSGTAAGVRSRGFTVPAAGKTGTSHDGWFAGFTSELLCIVWVGFDDNRELNLEGAHSALPIWTEFMKRALQFREYRNARPFDAPDGIVSVQIDPQSGMPATPLCPTTRTEVYILGTQPVGTCPLHGGGAPNLTNVAGWEVPSIAPHAQLVSPPVEPNQIRVIPKKQDQAAQEQQQPYSVTPAEAEKPKEKKGIFRKLLGVFK
jgi:penicillin-binding protein 1B